MDDQRISLFDSSIGDEDVIALDDMVYKVSKIRSIFKDLLQLNYKGFTDYLSQHNPRKFGLSSADVSMRDIYSDDYQNFEYIKLDNSDWKTGKLKIYLSTFLYYKNTYITNQLAAGCYFPHLSFDENDVISLQEDCFCKVKPIKAIFISVAKNGFGNVICSLLSQTVPEFANINLFVSGKPCELLRRGSSNWETFFLGIQFTIDALEISSEGDLSLLTPSDTKSPLDEIRNSSI